MSTGTLIFDIYSMSKKLIYHRFKWLFNFFKLFLSFVLKNICTPVSEIYVQLKYMLRINICTPLKVIFATKNIIGRLFRLKTQYISQLLTVLVQILKKTAILSCRCSLCIENESKGKYTSFHAPYTRFTSVFSLCVYIYIHVHVHRGKTCENIMKFKSQYILNKKRKV